MDRGDELVTTPSRRVAAASFDELYAASRGDIFRALATITADRDLATEAVDAGFTAWRRKLRRPAHVPPDVGVMGLALKWARRQIGKKSSQTRGFRLADPGDNVDLVALDRFKMLTLDERALLVMRDVLGWNDSEIRHALAADGIGSASRSLLERLERDGYDEERMARALQDQTATFVEPLARMESVKARGMIQRIGVFGAGVVLVIAAVVGAEQIVRNSSSATSEPPPGSTHPGPISGIGLTAENAVWEQVAMPVTGDNIMTLAHDGTNFYLLGMDNRGRAIMMESSTGVDWVAIPGPAGGQNMWFQQLVATPQALIAVGQGFDEFRGRESALVFITEDRETWSRIELPIENSIEVAGRVVEMHTWVSSVDVGPQGFTIVGSQGANFDPEELLRDLVDPELLRHGWGQDGGGMQFYDSQGNLVETMSWEELGLDPELTALISGSRSIVWTSEDGVDWETSEDSGPPVSQGIGVLAMTGNVRAALAWGQFGPSLWVEHDDEWARPDVDFLATGLTTWEDRLIAAGTAKADGRSGIWTTTDGISWDESTAPAETINQFFTSAAGIVGVGYETDAGIGALGPAEIQAGDFTVLASSDGKFQVVDGDGNTVVEVFEENVTRGDRITITHPDTGEVVVEFDDLAFEQAWQAVYRESEVGPRPERPEVSIVISEDGTNWTVLPVEDSGFHPSAIALGNGAMLLVGWSESGGLFGLGGQRPQLYLVHSG
jgi:hypothetical protein